MANAFAPHEQHDHDAGAEAQLAHVAIRLARDPEQSWQDQEKKYAAVSNALSGKEGADDHSAADHQKNPLEAGERSERATQLAEAQQPPADGNAGANQRCIKPTRSCPPHQPCPTRRLSYVPPRLAP